MSNVSLRLPNFLHKEVKEISKEEGISINQFISTALAEKMSALRTQEYLESCASAFLGVYALLRLPAFCDSNLAIRH